MLTPSLVQVTYVAGPPVVLKVRLNTTGFSLTMENWIVLGVPADSAPMFINYDTVIATPCSLGTENATHCFIHDNY